ncbi:IMP4 protein, partial [Crypturellus soui]|nr:IMP4 protein [Crypturellus soui]
SLAENRPLPPELRRDALALQAALEFDTPGGDTLTSSHDDEYRWAGLEPPRVVVTTSREPSARLRHHVDGGHLGSPAAILPGSHIVVGGHLGSLVAMLCGSHVGGGHVAVPAAMLPLPPDALVVSHLPHGPTAHFSLGGVVLRHDLPPPLRPTATRAPHLLLPGLGGTLGRRVGSILKHLFPVPRADSRRVVTFANNDDVISFRNHLFRRQGRNVELTELGPRFELRPYLIRLGTLEQGDAADVEWRLHPYTATAPKRRLLGDG